MILEVYVRYRVTYSLAPSVDLARANTRSLERLVAPDRILVHLKGELEQRRESVGELEDADGGDQTGEGSDRGAVSMGREVSFIRARNAYSKVRTYMALPMI